MSTYTKEDMLAFGKFIIDSKFLEGDLTLNDLFNEFTIIETDGVFDDEFEEDLAEVLDENLIGV